MNMFCVTRLVAETPRYRIERGYYLVPIPSDFPIALVLNPERRRSEAERIVCLTCGMASHHPADIAYRYCGSCHVFHDHATELQDVTRRHGLLDPWRPQ